MNTQLLMPELHNNERIGLRCSRSIEFVEVKKIIRAESFRAYCKLYIMDDQPITLSCPLKVIANKLSANQLFFRSHKSHLINMLYVKNYHTDKGIKLIDGSCVPLALLIKTEFLKRMEELFGCIEKETLL